jgi:hypothetical protein
MVQSSMQLVARAPDATLFLSTAALIIGIFLTAVAVALVANLPARSEYLARPAGISELDDRYKRFVRGVLFSLLIINTFGTLFPFSLLFVESMIRIQSFWILIAFVYTLFVVFANLGAVSLVYVSPAIVRRRQRRGVEAAPNGTGAEAADKEPGVSG